MAGFDVHDVNDGVAFEISGPAAKDCASWPLQWNYTLTRTDLQKGRQTLVCLLQGLAQDRVKTIIELRDESEVYGEVVSVDGYMNTTILNATFKGHSQEDGKFYESFFVIGKHIRYIHIPDGVHVENMIKRQLTISYAKSQARIPLNERKRHSTSRNSEGRGAGRSRFWNGAAAQTN